MLRILTLIGLLAIVSGCQTGGTDTAGALSSAAGTDNVESAVDSTEEAPALDADGNLIVVEGESAEEGAVVADQETAISAPPDEQRSANPIVASVQAMAYIRGKDGESAAVLAVLDCYKKAREKSVSLTAARICAAQDFVVSREVISKRPASATGTNDRVLLVSKRHAERIGALMKLKGMNQSQFNTFGAYLHAIAEPEYQKARQS